METIFQNGLTERMLEPGKFIDVLNTQNVWCVAVIIDQQFRKSLIKLNFEGYNT